MALIDNNASVRGDAPVAAAPVSVWDLDGTEHKMAAANVQDMVMHNKWVTKDPALVTKQSSGDYGEKTPKIFERPKPGDAPMFEVFDKDGKRHLMAEGSAYDVVTHLGWTTKHGESRDGHAVLGPAVEVEAAPLSAERPLASDDDPTAVAKELNRLRGAPVRIEGVKPPSTGDADDEDTSAYSAIDLSVHGTPDGQPAIPPRAAAKQVNLSAMKRDALAAYAKEKFGLDIDASVTKEKILEEIVDAEDA